jgi:arginine/lysine/ornithine decarboxylase
MIPVKTEIRQQRATVSLDHRRAPLVEAMQRYMEDDVLPFSTPGHKRGAGIDEEFAALVGRQFLSMDIPVGGGLDDTHFSGDVLVEAERYGADAWGADRTFYLVNGSSAGNHAFLLANAGPGDTVIVARDMHKSLMVALILAGVNPVYISPRLHPERSVGMGIDAADVAAALDAHPEATLVALVSPSYCGVPSDLHAIAAVAHARGVPVFVDEAWGPHFTFHPDLPPSAMTCGVDGAVASTHKILGALTQSAVLNVQGPRVDPRKVKSALAMVQTTSPSAPILTSVDACRRQMALEGEALLGRAIALATDARRRLQAIPGIGVLDAAQLGVPTYDLTKLVIDVDGLGITGFAAEAILREQHSIQVEMSDLVSLVAIVSLGDSQASIDRLVDAFEQIAAMSPESSRGTASLRSSGSAVAPGEQAMSPREAFFAPARAIPLADAVGRISAELVIPYPPGIPVLAPGDVISASKVEYLREGAAHKMYFSGPVDGALDTIRVVDRG